MGISSYLGVPPISEVSLCPWAFTIKRLARGKASDEPSQAAPDVPIRHEAKVWQRRCAVRLDCVDAARKAFIATVSCQGGHIPTTRPG